MTITLRTNDHSNTLVIEDIDCQNAPELFSATVRMAASGFAYLGRFYFNGQILTRFVAALTSMDATLKGAARLGEQYEDGFIELSCTALGHVSVTGEFHDHPAGCHGTLRFDTDQTVLKSFIDEWKEAIASTDFRMD